MDTRQANCELPSPVVGWLCNHARTNYWRVASFYELDDLIQDGLMCAYKCRNRYGTELDPPHFMSLVKTAFSRHIADILRRQLGGSRSFVAIADIAGAQGETAKLDELTGTQSGEQDFAALVSELPARLRRVVECYLSADGPKKMRKARRSRLGERDETVHERFSRLTGFPLNRDFETELRAYLWEREEGLV